VDTFIWYYVRQLVLLVEETGIPEKKNTDLLQVTVYKDVTLSCVL
jgi:hypothetical protein